jgi:hypothetical protein
MVRRPYAADDCLCPLINVNMLNADMLVAAVPEATECLHLPSNRPPKIGAVAAAAAEVVQIAIYKLTFQSDQAPPAAFR